MDAILLHGVKTHNLKNLTLILPHRKLYVITGVSGSGKSSLAFDTLYAEGQRRYVESLSAYARQFLERMEKPEAESIAGIPPAIAIEAKNVISNARSTVGTQTEINDYLRVLFARIGHILCPDCHTEVTAHHPQTVADFLLAHHPDEEVRLLFKVVLGKKGKKYLKEFLPELERQGFSEYWASDRVVSADELIRKSGSPEVVWVCQDRMTLQASNRKRLLDSLESCFRYGHGEIGAAVNQKTLQFSEALSCASCRKIFRAPVPNLFSFNSPLGACPVCQGFGRVITLDWDLVIPDPNKSISGGAIEPWTKPSAAQELEQLLRFCESKRIPVAKPWKDLSQAHRHWILKRRKTEHKDDFYSVQDFFDYLEKKTYKMHVRIFLSKYRQFVPCQTCGETRLTPEALAVRVAGKNIFDFQEMSLGALHDFFEAFKLSADELGRVEPVFLEIKRRVRFLKEVGLDYLSLSRLSRTLSGGEVQRIHLATSLGSALVDTLYVLDEPSVGLHERDNHLLIRLLRELRDLGNTVIVVEHDRMMIEAADEILDLGPLGGERGGELLFQGKVEEIVKAKDSLTGKYLSGELAIERHRKTGASIDRHCEATYQMKPKQSTSSEIAAPAKLRRARNDAEERKHGNDWIRIRGAAQHNLKNINVDIPLKQFVVVTGVSGSGKSTLLYEVLDRYFQRSRGRGVQEVGKVRVIEGLDGIDDLVLIDQSPIGRTSRSNPATYLKAYDDIRKIFSRLPQSRREGFEAGHFSFNVDGGRCPVCKGDGRVKVEMHFLADVFVPCEECHGKRFKPAILEVRLEGKNIDDVLGMTVDDAVEFFKRENSLVEKLEVLKKVGLGYLRLGQSATTLSGGEAQRLKLASEMTERRAGAMLYLFDEPTTGLHYHDIHYLMRAFEELLERGHSLVIIEHNMEVIRCADYVIDLGPEGGDRGGEVLYQGPLAGILEVPESYTGTYLRKHLSRAASVIKGQKGAGPF